MSYRHDFRSVEREAYWTAPRIIFWLFVFMLVSYGLGFIATGGDLFIYRFWAPKMENAKREVFENTQSYVQGKAEHLTKLRYDYERADDKDGQKSALRSYILTEASTVDNSKLPPDLQRFISKLKYEGE